MSAAHGTQRRYIEGCRCDECLEAHKLTARNYRERRPNGLTRPASMVVVPPIVEPDGLAQAALAMARLLDNPKAVNQQPAAPKVLAALLDKLHSASARGRRGNLSVVKSTTTSSPSA